MRIMVGCDENTFARERREMLTAHRIFIIPKSQPKARGYRLTDSPVVS